MTHQQLVESFGVGPLHTISAGLTVASIAGAWGTLAGVLPVIAAVIASCTGIAAIVSYVFATLDSPTFQRRVANWRMARQQRKLARLRKQQMVLTAKLQALDITDEAREAAKKIVADAQQGVICPAKSTRPPSP